VVRLIIRFKMPDWMQCRGQVFSGAEVDRKNRVLRFLKLDEWGAYLARGMHAGISGRGCATGESRAEHG
jgi:hypothetical protein